MSQSKVKLTISELKQQKTLLVRFERYLPTLTLKKFQLQSEYIRAREELEKAAQQVKSRMQEAKTWVAVLNEWPKIADLVKIKKISTRSVNVAGVDIPLFESVEFTKIRYNLYHTPPWVDIALEKIQDLVVATIRKEIADKRAALIYEELRRTLQRVNLFEKIMIPQTRSNIRKIQIYLADQQGAAVVRGKIAKAKVQAKTKIREGAPA